MYKILAVLIISTTVLITVLLMRITVDIYDTKGLPVRLLDKSNITCGYFLKRKNHNPYIIYYLYDGIELYDTDPDSCKKLSDLDSIENILVIDKNEELKQLL